MPEPPALGADAHVHSTFSDGTASIAGNVAEAERLGLTALGCVDHVRADTDWVPSYVAAVRAAAAGTTVVLTCGIEAKLLDTSGALDLPELVPGVDVILAADHQVPLADGPHHPREVAAALAGGDLSAREVLEAIVAATAAAVHRYPDVQLAHLFSVLPKIGLDEADVPLDLIEELAAATAESGARVEVSERWRCPSARTLEVFARRGLGVVASTDAHRPGAIGRYDYCAAVLGALAPAVAH